jgi:DNA-binding NtrC family response regulator
MKPEDICILIVDDEEPYRHLLSSMLAGQGFTTFTATDGADAMNAVQTRTCHIVLLDITMPRVNGIETLKFMRNNHPGIEVVMLTGSADLRTAVDCMKLGAYDFITKPTSVEDITTTVHRAVEHRRLRIDNIALKARLTDITGRHQIIGESPAFQAVIELAARVAPTDSTVLIHGASGTGKELIAQFLHDHSQRHEQPFVTINCASIPDTLLESELFGYEKGAFTDAQTTKQGIAEIADGGTLFLDEIGDISPVIQPKILRFVQSGEFRRVGGNSVLKANCRILSATNRDLRREVREGRFREDLFYRLNVITVTLPNLRSRPEDIPLLVRYFLEVKRKTKEQKSITPEAIQTLMEYEWPGNVRELENVIERAGILCRDNVITPADLSLPHGVPSAHANGGDSGALGTALPIKEIERFHIEGVLKSFRGNKAEAAKILGISLKTLYTKLQQYGIRTH